jgi:hypothetical protein
VKWNSKTLAGIALIVGGAIASEQLPEGAATPGVSPAIVDGGSLQFTDQAGAEPCPSVEEYVRWGSLLVGAVIAVYGRMVARGPLIALKGAPS